MKIEQGLFKGKEFELEGNIKDICGNDCLPSLNMEGNWAAHIALTENKYKFDDAPFYYGKIGSKGYIINNKDL